MSMRAESDSYSDYSDTYTEEEASNTSSSAKQRPAPAFTFASIPTEVSLALGEYCTVVLKPGKNTYIIEIGTSYPRESVNRMQLTIGEHGCSITQTENSVKSSVTQSIVDSRAINLCPQTPPLDPIVADVPTHGTPPIPERPRLNPRDFYRRQCS